MMKGTMAVDVSQDWATTCDVQQRFMHHAVPPADGISYAALANLDLISFKCKEASRRASPMPHDGCGGAGIIGSMGTWHCAA